MGGHGPFRGLDAPPRARPSIAPRETGSRTKLNCAKGSCAVNGMSCSLLVGRTLTLDMARLTRLERLRLAALRLRDIQNEAVAIYRNFPELDRRPRSGRARRSPIVGQEPHPIAWAAKLH